MFEYLAMAGDLPMDDIISLGLWIKRRRKALDLTQPELAQQVSCSLDLIQKIEADARRPSREMAARLADKLELAADERAAFIQVARMELGADRLAPPAQSIARGAFVPAQAMSSAAETPGRRHTTRPTNVPTPPTALIGREPERAALGYLLCRSDTRLVTLTGPGGIGKTRLALQVAADLAAAFADGVVFVDLAPIHDPELVSTAIARALGLLDVGTQPLMLRLQTALRDTHLLLVLDNFEQVLMAAPVVADLLAAAPQLTILLTSRVVVGVYGEHTVPVPSLQLPDLHALPALDALLRVETVRLFVERARAARPNFRLTPATARAVSTICHHLDGLPLSIELAAARVRLLPPQMLLDRLSSRLSMLTGGSRTLPARQQTLRDTLAWSYDLLDAHEQLLFRRLAVFVGGCRLEAAEAVASELSIENEALKNALHKHPAVNAPCSMLNLIGALLDQSLVQPAEGVAGEPRFTMLETIREYALEQLEASDEAEQVRRRHAEHYLALAETAEPHLRGRERGAWLDRLEVEHDNLRAALEWALEGSDMETGARIAIALAGQHWDGLWSRIGY